MSQNKTAQSTVMDAEDTALVIERIFDAPRELVWRAWSDPQTLARWWGPKGYTTPTVKMDFRVGGKFLGCMRSPDGKDFWSTGVYKEIVPMERLVTTDSFADPDGNIVSAAYYGMEANFPLELLVIVTFEDLGGKTKMTLRHEGMPAGEMKEGSGQGWNEFFDKLADILR